MAISEARSSSDAAPASQGKYDVFLNFRGEDTRHGFTDFLYHGLKDAGVHVYRDEEELPVGEVISEELKQAIKNTKIYIPIFSQTYASSKWCLRELALMIDNVSESEGRKSIFPIFFHVEPDDVKLKKKLYEVDFEKHEEHCRDEVEAWKGALRTIDNFKGWIVKKDSSQAEVVKLVIKEVLKKLAIKQKLLAEHLVGLVDPEKKLTELLDVNNSDVRIIGIYGMAGIGKTTVAKSIYNKLSSHFGRFCSFLQQVQESSSTEEGILQLQKKLISDIDDSRHAEVIEDSEHGMWRIGQIFFTRKVLVVLDDVDDQELIKNLTGNYSLYLGSRLIITTRNTTVLKVDGFKGKILLYEMPRMDNGHALQLFCWHAFGTEFPLDDYRECSNEIVSCMGGLPLAIEVVGSLLKGKKEAFWKETLDKLKNEPEEPILKKLKISYDDLEHYQKQIFLDIACFLYDDSKSDAIYMWADCNLYPERGMDVLTSRCLIKILDNDKFWMHDQLIALGRQIVREESPHDFGKRSRLWTPEEALQIIRTNKRKDNIEALEIYGLSNSIKITSKQLEQLPYLRFLKFGNGTFIGDFTKCHSKLRWISWSNPPQNFRANNMYLDHLLVFKLDHGDFTDDSKAWDLIKGARNLKVLSLTECHSITSIPNFSKCTSLERLTLARCNRLKRIESFIGDLQSLIHLEIEGCRKLTYLPIEVGALVKLEHFSLSGCYELRELPSSLENITSLMELDLSHTGVAKLPNSITKLKLLQVLRLSKYGSSLQRHVWQLPNGISMLVNLEELDLSGNGEMGGKIPSGIGELLYLKILNLSGTCICMIPTTINKLPDLQTLNLKGCHMIERLPELPTSLTSLLLQSESLLTVPDLSNHTNLVELQLSDGSQTTGKSKVITRCNLTWIGGLSGLKRLDLNLLNFPTPPELASLSYLEELTLSHLALETPVQLPSSLQRLILKFFSIRWAQSLPSYLKLSNLSTLEFWSGEVEDIPLDGLPQLENLIVHDCKLLRRLAIPLELRMLQQACVACCPELVEIRVVGLSESLKSFFIFRCVSLTILRGLSYLKNTETLAIERCKVLANIGGLDKLGSLKYLKVKECKSLKGLIDASRTNIPDHCHVEIEGHGISMKRYREKILLDTSNKPPETIVVLKLKLHCTGCVAKIYKITTKTKGVHSVSFDADKDMVMVMGAVSAEALAELLREKLKRPVKIVLPRSETKEKEGSEKNMEGDGCHKEAEIISGWGKVEGQRMEFQGACGYGQCSYGLQTYCPPQLIYYSMPPEVNTSCAVM